VPSFLVLVEQGRAICSALHSHGFDCPGATSDLSFPCVSNFILTLLADATQILYPCMQCADIFFLKASIYRAIAFHGIPKEILLNSL